MAQILELFPKHVDLDAMDLPLISALDLTKAPRLTMSEYIVQKYEADSGEPWSALEARVRARHPWLAQFDESNHD